MNPSGKQECHECADGYVPLVEDEEPITNCVPQVILGEPCGSRQRQPGRAGADQRVLPPAAPRAFCSANCQTARHAGLAPTGNKTPAAPSAILAMR